MVGGLRNAGGTKKIDVDENWIENNSGLIDKCARIGVQRAIIALGSPKVTRDDFEDAVQNVIVDMIEKSAKNKEINQEKQEAFFSEFAKKSALHFLTENYRKDNKIKSFNNKEDHDYFWNNLSEKQEG